MTNHRKIKTKIFLNYINSMLIYVNITDGQTDRQTHQKHSSEPHKKIKTSSLPTSRPPRVGDAPATPRRAPPVSDSPQLAASSSARSLCISSLARSTAVCSCPEMGNCYLKKIKITNYITNYFYTK